ncbi:hypothetical protein RUM44_004274 [Polyplax serrata]|uniref:Uncharacterized protein n=1 Tax=Polyplax serrata TaxID=468196 RepID=A0ABR1B2D8_POLSC
MLETLLLKNGNEIVSKSEKPAMTSTFSMENLLNSKIVGKLSGQKNVMIKFKKENQKSQLSPEPETEKEVKRVSGSEEGQNDFYSDNSISPNFETCVRKSEDSDNKNYAEGQYDRSRSPDVESQGSTVAGNLENSPAAEDERFEKGRERSCYSPQRMPAHHSDNFPGNIPPNFFKQESVFSQFFRNENYLISVNNSANRNSIYFGNQNLCSFDCYRNPKGLPIYRENRNFHRCGSVNCISCDGAKVQRLDGLPGKCKSVHKREDDSVADLKSTKGKDEDLERSPVQPVSPFRTSDIECKPALKFSVNAILGTNHQGIHHKPGKTHSFPKRDRWDKTLEEENVEGAGWQAGWKARRLGDESCWGWLEARQRPRVGKRTCFKGRCRIHQFTLVAPGYTFTLSALKYLTFPGLLRGAF